MFLPALKQSPGGASLMPQTPKEASVQPGETLFVMFTLVLVVVVLGGFGLIGYSFMSRQRLRELAVRERIAMIERGLVPPPEVDPAQFDRAVNQPRHPAYTASMLRISAKAQRYRSAGVMLMGLGFGLVMLIGFAAGSLDVAFGVGGGLAALGAAVFLNGMLMTRDADTIGDIPIHQPRTPGAPPNVAP